MVRRSCECCGFPWIETLAEMGHINPFFEKAGFQKVAVPPGVRGNRVEHSALYGSTRRVADRRQRPQLSEETHQKSRFAEPVYFVFDNRANV